MKASWIIILLGILLFVQSLEMEALHAVKTRSLIGRGRDRYLSKASRLAKANRNANADADTDAGAGAGAGADAGADADADAGAGAGASAVVVAGAGAGAGAEPAADPLCK